MKINVLAWCVYLNQSDKSKWRVSESLIWLATRRRSRPPSRLQNSVSERIVPKLQAQRKERRSCTYRIILGNVCSTYTSHLDNWHSLFFYTYRLVLRSQSVLQFFKLLFSLANHCSQACSAFDGVLAKKTCQKCKRWEMESRRIQIIFISR